MNKETAPDPQFAQSRTDSNGIRWTAITEWPLEGKGWTETEAPFDRLPSKAKGVVRQPVWDLSRHSAGLATRFVTDATTISLQWRLRCPNLAMDHMPATGVSGVDLYVRVGKGWRWIGIGRPTRFPDNQMAVVSGMKPGRREYMLYLPLYNGVTDVAVGVSADSMIEPAPPRPAGRQRPICFYGTSITQGGCCSRPGMAYTAILGRRLNRPVVNLGFSGNGQAEPEIAQLLAELDPCVYVVDCLPNLQEPLVTQRVEPLVRTIRRARPRTPIILVENMPYQHGFLVPSARERSATSNAALKAIFKRLVASGERRLFYVKGDRLLGTDGEATVDGCHFTDIGYMRFSDVLEPVLRKALSVASAPV